jgi:hypothetical protein
VPISLPRVKLTSCILVSVKRFALVGFLLSCAVLGQPPYHQQWHEKTLASGRKISVSEWQDNAACTSGNHCLLMEYETSLKAAATSSSPSTAEEAALRREVDEIWPILQRDAERLKIKEAIIWATYNSPKVRADGLIGISRQYTFQKRADGSWWCLNDKARDAPKQNKVR